MSLQRRDIHRAHSSVMILSESGWEMYVFVSGLLIQLQNALSESLHCEALRLQLLLDVMSEG